MAAGDQAGGGAQQHVRRLVAELTDASLALDAAEAGARRGALKALLRGGDAALAGGAHAALLERLADGSAHVSRGGKRRRGGGEQMN